MNPLIFIACLCAAIAAMSFVLFWLEGRELRMRRKHLHTIAAGRESSQGDCPLESSGVTAYLICLMQAESKKLALKTTAPLKVLGGRFRISVRYRQMIRVAGLAEVVSVQGVRNVRVKLALAGLALGGLVGLSLSNELGGVLAAGGAVLGFTSCTRALTYEGRLRTTGLEHHLSEMIEVVSLGLRSGLSFDKAFELYHAHFETGLSFAAAKAQQRWTMGLSTREEALRDLAAGYDSSLFSRVIENIIRSLRFGSSLAESLEATSVEARAAHKARMEEAVAKAPVKMMVPTGTLILPAMLLLVLGPVLLDMMQGF